MGPIVHFAEIPTLLLLGAPRIAGPDGEFTGAASHRHRLALLSLLSQAPDHVALRERLVGLLWPERSSPAARQLLSVSVYELRRALGDDVLLAHGQSIRLNTTRLAIDTIRFVDAVDQHDAERAVAVYAAPFLDGFFLPAARAFDEWMEAERNRLERLYWRALEEVTDRCAENGALQDAVQWCQLRLTRSPTNGSIALRMMQLLELTGDRGGAIEVADDQARLLRDQYEAEPEAAVVRYAARLRSGPVSARAQDSLRRTRVR
jgi:DNA-binding SARP family transcriptional activator